MTDEKSYLSTYHGQDIRYKGPLDIAPTVMANYGTGGNNQPFVVESHLSAGGFCTEHSADSRGIGYETECAPTLRAGVVPGVAIAFDPSGSRIDSEESDSQTTDADGNAVPVTSDPQTTDADGNAVPVTLKIRSGCEGGGKGPLIQKNLSATLATNNDQTLFEPKVYGICSEQSNAMLSENPHSGFMTRPQPERWTAMAATPCAHKEA